MYFHSALFCSVLAFAGIASATPALEERQSGTITPPPFYYLQTKVVGHHKDCGTNKNNLWVYSYHTGAGLGDAVLSANKSIAMKGYLNDTKQLFVYPNDPYGGWPMAILPSFYTSFSTVTIGVSQGVPSYEHFFFNSSGLQYNETYHGWLACDWWHGSPQLFNLNGFYNGPLPKTCSKVDLFPIAA